jgi:hypothetical protein
MENNSLENISLSDSELSIIDEGPYTNVPTAEINVDTFSEYSPEIYIPSYMFTSVENQFNELPLTLPIEYLSAAREILISLATLREQTPNEIPIYTASTNDIDMLEQLSVSTIDPNFPTNETWLDSQLQNYDSPLLFEAPLPVFGEQIPAQDASTNHLIQTNIQSMQTEPINDVIFNDIDRIINLRRRSKDGRRVMSVLCAMTNGEQRWVSSRQLRRDARVSEMLDRYHRDLRHPHKSKRTSKKKRK